MLPPAIRSPCRAPGAVGVEDGVGVSAWLLHPWVLAGGSVWGGPVGTGTFSAPQEDTGELAAVQRALEKAHWKKD